MTCADAVKKLLKGNRGVGGSLQRASGSKGERWYAWAWLGTASPRHSLLVRRHLKTVSWRFTTASCPRGSWRPRPG